MGYQNISCDFASQANVSCFKDDLIIIHQNKTKILMKMFFSVNTVEQKIICSINSISLCLQLPQNSRLLFDSIFECFNVLYDDFQIVTEQDSVIFQRLVSFLALIMDKNCSWGWSAQFGFHYYKFSFTFTQEMRNSHCMWWSQLIKYRGQG